MSDQSVALLFPGQGSQYPGIGKDLYDAYDIIKDTYAEASDTLGLDMEALSFNDPDGEIPTLRSHPPELPFL